MADTIYDEGRGALFLDGWTSKVTLIRLYTSADVLVDEQSVTFTYNTDRIQITSNVVFDVPAGTNNVSYVEIGRYDNPLYSWYYRKDLTQLYDFATAGQLTIDLFRISASATPLQPSGREALFTTGWVSTIAKMVAKDNGGTTRDTQTCSFVLDTSNNNNLKLNAQVNLEIAEGITITNCQLLGTADAVYWSKTLPSPAPYTFNTSGQLRVKTWSITT